MFFGMGGGGGMPFGMGGFGDEGPRGGGGGGRAANKPPADTEEYYKLLGVDKSADEGAIRKAFLKLAKVHHPDKGGDTEKFKKLSKAAEVLSDPKKRAVYDEYGEEGLEGGAGEGGGGGGSAADIIAEMFGGGGGRRRGGGGGPRKGKDSVHPLDVSLEDLYNGRTVRLAITRDTFCDGCAGSGATAGASEADCGTCRGRGMVTRIAQIGPGMISQMSSPCPACRGAGRVIPEDKKCKKCAGKKIASQRKVVEVHIERGMKHGSKITFRGEGGDEPGAEPGDLIFVVQQKSHGVFKREGNDLFIDREIALADALAGVQFTVTHLDKRRLRVSSGAGEVISPGTYKCVEGAGMPIPATGGMRFGDLYIKFAVAFPASGSLPAPALVALRAALPASRKGTTASCDGSKPGDVLYEDWGSKAPAAPALARGGSSGGGAGKGSASKPGKGGGGGKDKNSKASSGGGSARDEMDADGISIREGHGEGASGGAGASGADGKHAREGEVEDVVMSSVTAESRAERVRAQQEAAGHGEAYDSDEEEGPRRGGVQCAHQ